MGPVLAIAATSLRRFLRDKSNYFFVFVFPLLMVVIIGLQFGDRAAATIIVVGDGVLTDSLVSRLEDDGITVRRLDDAEDARSRLARRRADAAVVITPDDEDAFADAATVDVEVATGSTDLSPLIGPVIDRALSAIDRDQAAVNALVDAGADRTAAIGAQASAADAGPRMIESVVGDDTLSAEFDGLGRFDLGAAQQLSLFVFLSSLTAATSLIQSRHLGVTRRELSAPIRPGQVILGEVLGRFVIAFTQGIYIIVGSALLFGVNWGDLTATGTVLLAFCGVSASAAMVLGALLDNENAAGGVGVGLGLVLAALGGSMFPLEFMPDAMRRVSAATPHRWAYEAYAEITRRGGGIDDVARSLAVLMLMTAVLLPLGSLLLRRSLDRAL